MGCSYSFTTNPAINSLIAYISNSIKKVANTLELPAIAKVYTYLPVLQIIKVAVESCCYFLSPYFLSMSSLLLLHN